MRQAPQGCGQSQEPQSTVLPHVSRVFTAPHCPAQTWAVLLRRHPFLRWPGCFRFLCRCLGGGGVLGLGLRRIEEPQQAPGTGSAASTVSSSPAVRIS